jgi:hypothetical protein
VSVFAQSAFIVWILQVRTVFRAPTVPNFTPRTRCEDHGLRHSEFNVAWVWGSVPQLVSCLSQERSRSAKGRGANSDLSRNIRHR